MDPADADLERLLDRELKKLPAPRAPQSLLPRVMAASSASPQTAPATGWSTWSPGWQASSVAVLLLFVATVAWLFSAPPAPVVETTRTAGEIAAVMRVFWDVLLQPVATYIFVLGLSLALACAAAWAALELALGGASHQ
ncbi:MAG TPA: hypothetical protein VM493_07475 [Vicinamibacterales bacterium]|nr:hypothetical protein [Vicinamibacterales bacterium]